MVDLLVSFASAGNAFSEDQKRNYADLIVDVFELKVRGLL